MRRVALLWPLLSSRPFLTAGPDWQLSHMIGYNYQLRITKIAIPSTKIVSYKSSK